MEREADQVVRSALARPKLAEVSAPTLNRPPGRSALPSAGGGEPLPKGLRRRFQPQLDLDLSPVRLHRGPSESVAAAALGARAFTVGSDIVFGAGAPPPETSAGLSLLGHELAHVGQQARGQGTGLVQRQPVAVAEQQIAELPDDSTFGRGVDRQAEDKNIRWFVELDLAHVAPIRDIDPWQQPHSYANRVHRAQTVMLDAGIGRVEDSRLDADGIQGPRTILGLLIVARDADHPARAEIQGLGFDLDAVGQAATSELRARAHLRPAVPRLRLAVEVLGEAAVRFYDRFYALRTLEDQRVFDDLLFGGDAPGGLRAEDRIQILHRLYGTAGQQLSGTLEIVVAERDFLTSRIDVGRAVRRDAGSGVRSPHFFSFTAVRPARVLQLVQDLHLEAVIEREIHSVNAGGTASVQAALSLLSTQTAGPEPGTAEVAGALVAVYLPEPDRDRARAVAELVLDLRAGREQVERQRVEAGNREAARGRAEQLIAILDDDDTNHLLVDSWLRTELKRAARERMHFDLVLDELRAQGRFDDLFGRTEDLGGTHAIGLLLRAARAGRYRDDPRVLQAQRVLVGRTGEARSHRYVVDPGGDPTLGAVFLDGEDRVASGQTTGEVSDLYLRDEKKEQLKPGPAARMDAALEVESRLYFERLAAGREDERTPEEVGWQLIGRAGARAGIDEDRDIEDVVWEETIRVFGVRYAPDVGDGVPRYEIHYERVQRIRGGQQGTPRWEDQEGVAGTRKWASENEFGLDLFWYSFSQTSDVVLTAAKVVAVGATVAVAWEVGLIGVLVKAGGGALPVGLSIGASGAIYWFTHERRTLEGLLVAGVEGYLGAVGFKYFARAGSWAGRLVLPSTLTEVTFGRAIAAWLVRKGVTGAATGGSLGIASTLMHDVVRVAGKGGGPSSLSAYAHNAGAGMLLGAVFEIGGSALLAPLFRNADASTLARVDDVVATLNQTQPRLTPAQWMAHASRGLSATRQMFELLMYEAQARTMSVVIAERVAEIGRRWLAGARTNIHREILELAEANISHEALDGLERLVRVGAGSLGDDAVITLLQQARRTPDRIDPWLRFLSGLDDAATGTIADRANQLRTLLDADAAMALAARRGAGEINRILGQRFGHVVADLDAFATRLNRLESEAADAVLDALAARGTGVTPTGLLRAAEVGEMIDDQLLGGMERLHQSGVDPARLDAVVEALEPDQVGPFVRSARAADQASLDQTRGLVTDFGPAEVAWALRLPLAQAHTLLGQLTPSARGAIADIGPAEASALLNALTPARVNRALSHGEAGPLRGSHLQSLRSSWTDRSIVDYLEYAKSTAKRLDAVARVARGFEAANRLGVAAPRATSATSVALDSSAAIGVRKLLGGSRFHDLKPNERGVIHALRREQGLDPYIDPPEGVVPTIDHIVGEAADLRSGPTSTAELLADAGRPGHHELLAGLGGIGSGTAHPDYQDVLGDLTEFNIGRTKGAPDRAIVADALLAPRPGGARPVFATSDQDVLVGLARNFGHPNKFAPAASSTSRYAQLVDHPHFGTGRFTIEIRGHQMIVIYR